MTLLNSNSGGYEGTTTVNNGILNIQNGSALGQADGTNATATIVNGNGATNGTLQLQGNITVANEKLTLNNTGFNNNGALQNVSGNNTWSGPVVLGSDSRVQSDSGTLTMSGAITSTSNSTLNVGGAGNTTISGAIGTGNGGVTKDGTGTLILSGNNTYAGNTLINQGVLSLQHSSGLGSTTGTTTIAGPGAALQLDNTAAGGGGASITTLAEPLNLIGTGIGGTGALRNVSGNNTFAGAVSIATPSLIAANPGITSSLITANAGTTMTLSGGVQSTAGSGHNLTVGTTAQNGNVTISGSSNLGSMSLTKAGTGTLTFSGASNTVGQTQINAGTLAVGSGATLNSGALGSLGSTTLSIASGGTVAANYTSGTTVFSGAISGAGEFEKLGAGTLQFNGTSFNAGAGSTLTLSGGTLALLGSQVTFDTIHITGNTILDFSNSAGTFLSSANLIIDAGVTVTVNNWVSVANNAAQSTAWYLRSGPGTGGLLNNSITLGANDISGGSGLSQIVFNNYNGLTTTWVSSGVSNGWLNHEIRPTPEPSTYGAILLGGCLGLLGWRRYRKGKAQAAVEVK
jgi:autotransporter-associated beta strand protein